MSQLTEAELATVAVAKALEVYKVNPALGTNLFQAVAADAKMAEEVIARAARLESLNRPALVLRR